MVLFFHVLDLRFSCFGEEKSNWTDVFPGTFVDTSFRAMHVIVWRVSPPLKMHFVLQKQMRQRKCLFKT